MSLTSQPPAELQALASAGLAQLAAASGGNQAQLAEQFAGLLLQIAKGLPPEGRSALKVVIQKVLAELDQ